MCVVTACDINQLLGTSYTGELYIQNSHTVCTLHTAGAASIQKIKECAPSGALQNIFRMNLLHVTMNTVCVTYRIKEAFIKGLKVNTISVLRAIT